MEYYNKYGGEPLDGASLKLCTEEYENFSNAQQLRAFYL